MFPFHLLLVDAIANLKIIYGKVFLSATAAVWITAMAFSTTANNNHFTGKDKLLFDTISSQSTQTDGFINGNSGTHKLFFIDASF